MWESLPVLGPDVEHASDSAGSLEAAVNELLPRLPASKSGTVVLNDPQRATPSDAVLKMLREALSEGNWRILVATGTHRFDVGRRRAFERALRLVLPAGSIAWHDCRSERLRRIDGDRPWRGHPWLLAGDGPLLAIGSSEPHYFAGVTGAHKTVTIGCAAVGDVEINHAAALSAGARPGRLDGNPVHEDIAAMLESLQLRREVLAINLLHVGARIPAAAAGAPLEALKRILPAVKAAYCLRIPSPADALILEVTGVLGGSFYQADKAIKNNEWAVRDGGALVLAADCPDGIGQNHFVELLRACPTYQSAVAEVRRRGYRLGDHKAVKLRYLTDRRGVRVLAVSPGLSAGEARTLGLEKVPSVEAGLAAAGIDVAREEVYRVSDAAKVCLAVSRGL